MKPDHGSAPAPIPSPAPGELIESVPVDLVSLHLACYYTGHSPGSLVTLAKNGKFPTVYDFRRGNYKVSKSSLEEWLDGSRICPGESTIHDVKRFRQPEGARPRPRQQGGRNAS